ncbi:MAG: hypothetical protein DI538_31675, partial [Azospira oryzae]
MLGVEFQAPVAAVAGDLRLHAAHGPAAHLQGLGAQLDLAGQQAGLVEIGQLVQPGAGAAGRRLRRARGGQRGQALLPGIQIQLRRAGLQQHAGGGQRGQLVLHRDGAAQHARAGARHVALQLGLQQRRAGGAQLQAQLVAAAGGG